VNPDTGIVARVVYYTPAFKHVSGAAWDPTHTCTGNARQQRTGRSPTYDDMFCEWEDSEAARAYAEHLPLFGMAPS
jgi:hypothetical protein